MPRDIVKANSVAAVANTTTTVVAANLNRSSITLSNDSAIVIYLAFGTSPTGAVPTAVVNSGLRLAAGATATITDFTGAIAGISTSGTNNVLVVEV